MRPVFETIALTAGANPLPLDMEGFSNLAIFTSTVPDVLLGAEYQMSRSITVPTNINYLLRNISIDRVYLKSGIGGDISVSRW